MQKLGQNLKGGDSRFRETGECVCGSRDDVNGIQRIVSSVPYLKVHASRVKEMMKPGFSPRTREWGMDKGGLNTHS